jgi:hypothetical protein
MISQPAAGILDTGNASGAFSTGSETQYSLRGCATSCSVSAVRWNETGGRLRNNQKDLYRRPGERAREEIITISGEL